MPVLVEDMNLQIAEPSAEGDLLRLAQILIGKAKQQVLVKRLADRREIGLGQRPSEIEAARLGAHCRRQRPNIKAGAALRPAGQFHCFPRKLRRSSNFDFV